MQYRVKANLQHGLLEQDGVVDSFERGAEHQRAVRVRGGRADVALSTERTGARIKGALCAYVIRLRVSYNQNEEIISQNSLRYLSKANLPIAVD